MSKSSKDISTIYSCLLVMKKDNGLPFLSDKYLDEYAPTISLSKLLLLKRNEKNTENKGCFDILIARKIKSMEHILENNTDILKKYLPYINNINDFDAVGILLESKIDDIFKIAYEKYCETIEKSLEQYKDTENILLGKNGIDKKKKSKILSLSNNQK